MDSVARGNRRFSRTAIMDWDVAARTVSFISRILTLEKSQNRNNEMGKTPWVKGFGPVFQKKIVRCRPRRASRACNRAVVGRRRQPCHLPTAAPLQCRKALTAE